MEGCTMANLALVPDANCIEYYRQGNKYLAVENGITHEVEPDSKYFRIAREAAIRHSSYSRLVRKYGRGEALVYGFIDLVWSGFNSEPDVISGKFADQDGDLYTSLGKVNPREREVIRKIAEGMSDKEIAEELFISVNTVTTTIRNIRVRFNATSKYHIISKAALAGIL